MTISVCIYCGALKGGAFVPCSSCNKAPTSEDELVRSFILTDHHLSVAKLNEIGEQVKKGIEIKFKGEMVRRVSQFLKLLGLEGIISQARTDSCSN
jgi:hypothetical protein